MLGGVASSKDKYDVHVHVLVRRSFWLAWFEKSGVWLSEANTCTFACHVHAGLCTVVENCLDTCSVPVVHLLQE